MNTVTNKSVLKLAAALALVLGGLTSALAGTVGGSVDPIATLTSVNDVTNITVVAATGQTDTKITSGVIDNNNDHGWKLTVTSANHGILERTTGTGDNVASRITYTSVKLLKTGGTLGAGLTDPSTQSHNIATGASYGDVVGTTSFNTGVDAATHGTATTATVAYAFDLKISWSANTALLSGTYSDTITMSLADDI